MIVGHDGLSPGKGGSVGQWLGLESAADEDRLIAAARPLLAQLIEADVWLPESCAVPHPEFYQQFLLHCDPLERFSLVSFVWGPGQKTPIHDHQTWGLIGMLRGAELGQHYQQTPSGMVASGPATRLEPGQVEAVSPTLGDIHRVSNAFDDRVSISIHLYGGNIGGIARHVFDPATGKAAPFVSGYSSVSVPNLWDRSAVTRRRIKESSPSRETA
jgi:predicted metal-dependent enzyme (double-stranded beta helix superfamily)